MSEGERAHELAATIRRRLGQPPELPDWSLVSIVVLNRDGVGHLRRLLPGLIECTDYPRLELILVDNASSDDSLDYVRTLEAPFPISILINPSNESFSDGNNQGAELAHGELLLFLNNDIEPFEPAWLRELVACLRSSKAAAVGSTLVQRERRPGSSCGYVVQQRGLVIRSPDGGRSLASAFRDHLADPLGETLGVDAESPAVAGACLLIERRTFEQAGGFTHGYLYGGEDADLGLKLRSQGLGVVCSGRSVLIHQPGSIWKTERCDRVQEWTRGNRRFFLERWGPRLRREYELARLDGQGLWTEAGNDTVMADDANLVSASGSSRAEVEALGYCIKVGGPGGEELDARTRELAEALRDALLDRDHRCLVLWGAEVDDLRGFEYDVAVHLRGPARFAPKSAQFNVLWSIDGFDALTAIECSRYDLVASGSRSQAERLRQAGLATPVTVIGGVEAVSDLPAAVEARVREAGFPTRIG